MQARVRGKSCIGRGWWDGLLCTSEEQQAVGPRRR